MITIDPYNKSTENEDKCLICHDNINSEQNYSLPECNHKYHVDCIISWFRMGNTNCPYCNSNYENSENIECNYYSRSDILLKYKVIKKYSKRKNAHSLLKNKINLITKYEQESKEIKKELNEISKEIGSYKNLKNKYYKINSRLCSKNRIIYNKKRELALIVNIIPLTIIKK